MAKIILVVAAHSDDEALGCAGTLSKHIAAGDEVHILYMTDGVGSRHVTDDEVFLRKGASKVACDIIGITSISSLNFPDNKMDSVPLLDVVQKIEKLIDSLHPEIIYTHHVGDLNVDHQITHKAVLTACRPEPDCSVNQIYSFEVLSSTEWQMPGYHSFFPNVFVDISDFIEIKKKVLNVYSEEMRKPPHSRSIENAIRMCEVRGNAVGKKFVEAFMSIREIR